VIVGGAVNRGNMEPISAWKRYIAEISPKKRYLPKRDVSYKEISPTKRYLLQRDISYKEISATKRYLLQRDIC